MVVDAHPDGQERLKQITSDRSEAPTYFSSIVHPAAQEGLNPGTWLCDYTCRGPLGVGGGLKQKLWDFSGCVKTREDLPPWFNI